MLLINGHPDDKLAAVDRGFQYGDGIFTTMLVRCGVIDAWPRHLERMKSNIATLRIEGVDWQLVGQWVDQVARSAQSETNAVMKVIILAVLAGEGIAPKDV